MSPDELGDKTRATVAGVADEAGVQRVYFYDAYCQCGYLVEGGTACIEYNNYNLNDKNDEDERTRRNH